MKFPPKTTDLAFLGNIFSSPPNMNAIPVGVCNQITSILQITIPGLWATALNVCSIACRKRDSNIQKHTSCGLWWGGFSVDGATTHYAVPVVLV